MIKLLERYFALKLNKGRIKKHLEKLDFPFEPIEPSEPNQKPKEQRLFCDVKISCVQRSIKPANQVEDYIDQMYWFVQRAVKENSQLIVFPEYNFFDLLGLIPGFSTLNRYLNKKALQNNPYRGYSNMTSKSNLSPLNSIFRSMAVPVQVAIELIFSGLAKKSGLYIYTGSYLLSDGGSLYNAGALIDRTGELIGRQKKIHLTDFEGELRLDRCSDLQVFPLEIGNVAIPICMDATYSETFSIARKKGADLVILPIANNEEYHHFKALRGIWPRVQESYLYGIKSSLNGWLGGLHFTGKAGIFAPLEITPSGNGVIVSADHYEGDHLLTGAINLSKLEEARQRAEYFGDVNETFEHKLAKLYSSLK